MRENESHTACGKLAARGQRPATSALESLDLVAERTLDRALRFLEIAHGLLLRATFGFDVRAIRGGASGAFRTTYYLVGGAFSLSVSSLMALLPPNAQPTCGISAPDRQRFTPTT